MEQDRVMQEKAVLVGLNADIFSKEETATDKTLDELAALLETAGGIPTAKVLQNRHEPDPHSFVGEGKVKEICELLETTESSLLIFDNDLTPAQLRALSDLTGATVLDRSALILDIFAQRAKTREGRLQVELAQLQYLLPKLSGMGKSLSRLGGGIGTRGPGETKLESDRRHIRERIHRLQAELKEVQKVRGVQRERRIKNQIPVVAIVGYTNAGKSTLLNFLTDAGIPANNRLFDTLDTTTRLLSVSDTLKVLISDTVGFIAKLPHHLVEAFQATLEELQYADLLLHVIDASAEERDQQIMVVNRLVERLARPGIPVIECYNKSDLVPPYDIPSGENQIAISAKNGDGISALLSAIEQNLGTLLRRVTFCFPYSMGASVEALHSEAQVLRCDYGADGVTVEAVCDCILSGRYKEYVVNHHE